MIIRSLPFATCILLLAGSLRAQTQPAVSDDVEFAAFGLNFQSPPGWQRVDERSPICVARWQGKGNDPAKLEVLCEAQRGRTFDQFEREISTRFDTARSPDAIAVGGKPGLRLINGRPPGGDEKLEFIVVPHGNCFYTLSAFAPPDVPIPQQELLALAASIKFVEPIAPVRVLMLRRVFVKEVGVTLDLPGASRRANVRQVLGQTLVDYAAVNVREGLRADLAVGICMLPRGNTARELADKMNAKVGTVWRRLGADDSRLISNADRLEGDRAASAQKCRRTCLVQLADGNVVQLMFWFDTPHAADLAMYEKFAEAAARSVTSSPSK